MIYVAIAVLILALILAGGLLYLAEIHEPSNYERDELPPPVLPVTPQDWRRP